MLKAVCHVCREPLLDLDNLRSGRAVCQDCAAVIDRAPQTNAERLRAAADPVMQMARQMDDERARAELDAVRPDHVREVDEDGETVLEPTEIWTEDVNVSQFYTATCAVCGMKDKTPSRTGPGVTFRCRCCDALP